MRDQGYLGAAAAAAPTGTYCQTPRRRLVAIVMQGNTAVTSAIPWGLSDPVLLGCRFPAAPMSWPGAAIPETPMPQIHGGKTKGPSWLSGRARAASLFKSVSLRDKPCAKMKVPQ